MKKYKGAVSDTDILVHLATVGRLDIFELLFEEVVIPKEGYDREVRNIAGKVLGVINVAINKKDSIFKIRDQQKETAIRYLAREIFEGKSQVIGYGESMCAGYAKALNIAIIVSNNSTEFKWLPEFITLTYYDLLYLCVTFDLLPVSEANEVYDSVNDLMNYPSSIEFQRRCINSKKRIIEKIGINY